MSSQKLSAKIVILVQDIITDAQTVYGLQSWTPDFANTQIRGILRVHEVYLSKSQDHHFRNFYVFRDSL